MRYAVQDAKKYKLTLFLTFHRIQASSYDKPGYNVNDFEKIVKYIKDQEIKVKTLSELDKDNGLSQAKFEFHKGYPKQISLTISSNKVGIIDKFFKVIRN